MYWKMKKKTRRAGLEGKWAGERRGGEEHGIERE